MKSLPLSDSRTSTQLCDEMKSLPLSYPRIEKQFYDENGRSCFLKICRDHQSFSHEVSIYNELKELQGLYIPKLYECFSFDHDQSVIILECVGHELEKEDFTESVFDNIVKGLKKIHEHGVVLVDLKPEHIRIQEDQSIRFIDFDLSHCLSNPPPYLEYTYGNNDLNYPNKYAMGHFYGTHEFASLNLHLGLKVNFTADWESLYYISLIFLKKLPWINRTRHQQSATQKVSYIFENNSHVLFDLIIAKTSQEIDQSIENAIEYMKLMLMESPKQQNHSKIYDDSKIVSDDRKLFTISTTHSRKIYHYKYQSDKSTEIKDHCCDLFNEYTGLSQFTVTPIDPKIFDINLEMSQPISLKLAGHLFHSFPSFPIRNLIIDEVESSDLTSLINRFYQLEGYLIAATSQEGDQVPHPLQILCQGYCLYLFMSMTDLNNIYYVTTQLDLMSDICPRVWLLALTNRLIILDTKKKT